MLERSVAQATGGLLLAFVILLLTSCSTNISPWVHFKIIVDVEADGKTYSGSSVLGMRYANRERIGATGSVGQAEFNGEAPFVDIGEHGTLFALISHIDNYGGYSSFDQFFMIPVARLLNGGGVDRVATMERLAKMVGKGTELSCLEIDPQILDCPVMARFCDMQVPNSLVLVDPKNLSESFGPGVRLKSVRFEITDEPISEKIERKLPWFDEGMGRFEKFPQDIPARESPQPGASSWFQDSGYFKVDYSI